MKALVALACLLVFCGNVQAQTAADVVNSYVLHQNLNALYFTTMRKLSNTCGKEVGADPTYEDALYFEPVGSWRFGKVNSYRLEWEGRPSKLSGYQHPIEYWRFFFLAKYRSGTVKGKKSQVSVDVAWVGSGYTYKVRYDTFRRNGKKCRLVYWGAL